MKLLPYEDEAERIAWFGDCDLSAPLNERVLVA